MSHIHLSFSRNQIIAIKQENRITTSQFITDLQCVQAHLQASHGDILLNCKGRYAFTLVLLAAWQLERRVVLPPNQLPDTLKNLIQQHHIRTSLHDTDVANICLAAPPTTNSIALNLSFAKAQEALIIYTSGSSGQPTAVHKNIGNLFTEADVLRDTFHFEEKLPLLASVPAHHLYGLTFSIILPWVLQVPLLDTCPLHASEVVSSIQEIHAQTLITVPVHLKALLEENIEQPPHRVIVSAGRLDEALAKQWLQHYGVGIIEVYGSSETGILAHRQQLNDPHWHAFDQVHIVEQDARLKASSPFIHPSEGAYFQSKDHISLEANGFILHGRDDGIVKIAGKRISLLTVEDAILSCHGVKDVAVIAVPVQGHIRDIALWAAIAVDANAIEHVQAIRKHLQTRLDGAEMPRRIRLLGTLPREDHGKLQRDKLLEVFENTSP